MTDIQDKITNLKKNAAFQMSLSGKELFHSNMIAMFLTQVDDNTKQPTDLAKTMINLFPPNTMPEYKNNPDSITVFDVLREYQNLDLLICYCTKEVKYKLENKKICCVSDISDLDEHGNEEVDSSTGVDRNTDVTEFLKSMHYVIIENKFKSFPYKEQLDKYSQKVIDGMTIFSFKKEGKKTNIKALFDEKKNVANTTCYLLAPNGSLQAFYKNFRDKLFGNSKKILWSGISYETYYEELQPFENKQSKELMPQFIYEYRMFLETMINLYDECVEKRIEKNCFISFEHNKYLLQGRIQDFYEKIIYNRVLTKLRTEKIIKPNTETKSLENPKNGEWPFFSSNAYYSNQTGYLDFRYVWENSDINAGIQIQGSSFRIVFCHEMDFLKKVYGLSSFKGKMVDDYFENRDKNRNKRDTLEEFSKSDEIKDTKACIKYIYEKINGELSNSDTDIKLPELHFSKKTKDKEGKETIYSYSVSGKYTFRYGNCDLNEISPGNDYRELDYEKFKKLIKAALIVINQQYCYEELKNLPEVKKIKASL